MRCFCGELLNTTKEISDGYCTECQQAVRQVWDKDAFILGQEDKLAWTSIDEEESEEEYLRVIQYRGDTIYE